MADIKPQLLRATVFGDKELFLDQQTPVEFFTQYFHDRFEEHVSALSAELAKFEAATEGRTAGRRRTVNCYFTKNHTSAYARRSAGICTSECNPDPAIPEKLNQWDMPEFFQMVLQDDEKRVCLGGVFLHIYTDTTPEGIKRILTASFNPSSTFLYQVDQRELCTQLQLQLEAFALDNKVDMIAVSDERYNRTNRTGGEFESAINEAIEAVGAYFTLSSPQPISHKYGYRNHRLHVIWRNPGRWGRLVSWFQSLGA